MPNPIADFIDSIDNPPAPESVRPVKAYVGGTDKISDFIDSIDNPRENYLESSRRDRRSREDVERGLKSQFGDRIDVNRVGQDYQLQLERDKRAGQEESTLSFVARHPLNFFGAATATESYQYKKALDRFNDGKATPEDFRVIAQVETNRRHDRERSTGGEIATFGTELPAMLTEFELGGAATRGLGRVAPGALGRTLAGGRTAPLLTRAGLQETPGAAVRNLTTTAALPRFYAPAALQNAEQNGGDWYDAQNLGPAFALGYTQTAVLGSLNNQVARVPTRLGRFVAGGLAGSYEQQLSDTGLSQFDRTVKDVTGQTLGLDTKGGTLGALFRSEPDAWKHAIVQTATFGVFAAMHGRDPKAVLDATKKTVETAQEAKVEPHTLADAMNRGSEILSALMQANPKMTRAEARKAFDYLPEGIVKDHVLGLVDAVLPEKAPAGGEESPQPPHPASEPGQNGTGSVIPPPEPKAKSAESALLPLDALTDAEVKDLAASLGLSAKQLRQKQGEPWVAKIVAEMKRPPAAAPESRPGSSEPPASESPASTPERAPTATPEAKVGALGQPAPLPIPAEVRLGNMRRRQAERGPIPVPEARGGQEKVFGPRPPAEPPAPPKSAAELLFERQGFKPHETEALRSVLAGKTLREIADSPEMIAAYGRAVVYESVRNFQKRAATKLESPRGTLEAAAVAGTGGELAKTIREHIDAALAANELVHSAKEVAPAELHSIDPDSPQGRATRQKIDTLGLLEKKLDALNDSFLKEAERDPQSPKLAALEEEAKHLTAALARGGEREETRTGKQPEAEPVVLGTAVSAEPVVAKPGLGTSTWREQQRQRRLEREAEAARVKQEAERVKAERAAEKARDQEIREQEEAQKLPKELRPPPRMPREGDWAYEERQRRVAGAQTLGDYIRGYGGIDPDSLSPAERQELKEGGLGALLTNDQGQRGKNAIDTMAEHLIREGYMPERSDLNGSDNLLEEARNHRLVGGEEHWAELEHARRDWEEERAGIEAEGQPVEAGGNTAAPFDPEFDVHPEFGRPLTHEEWMQGQISGGQENATGARPGLKETALANARVDAERVRGNLPPLMSAARRANPAVWDAAMAKIARDPNTSARLVAELAGKKRSTTVDENALLLHRKIALNNEYERAMRQTIEAAFGPKKNDAAYEKLSIRTEELRSQIDTLDRVLRDTGTEWGRAGQFRRQLAKEDFSLSRMMMEAQTAKGKPLTKEEVADIVKQQKEIAEAETKLDDTEGGKEPAKTPGALGDLTDLKIAVKTKRRTFDETLAAFRRSNRPLYQKVFDTGLQAVSASRAIITAFDLSAVFRQGGILTASHSAKAGLALKDSLRSMFSIRHFERAQEELLNRPNALNGLYKESGLFLSDIHGQPTAQEEAFIGRWAKKIPGISASERQYTSFLNRMRADVFDSMAAGLPRDGVATAKEAKAIANYVNVATGRGNLGPFENAAGGLAQVFFSPRYLASRFQILAGQPFYGGTWRTRGKIAVELGRSLAGLGLFYALAKAFDKDAEITFDPRSSDFGKVKMGEFRVDPLAGMSQVMVFTARLVSGETKSTTTGEVTALRGPYHQFGQTSTADVVTRFLRSKLAPVPGALANAVTGETAIGEPATWKDTATNMLVPISIRDVYDAMRSQGTPRGVALALLAILGMGTAQHDQRVKMKPAENKAAKEENRGMLPIFDPKSQLKPVSPAKRLGVR